MCSSSLLDELRNHGVEFCGVEVDHEDLVQLVQAARTLARMAASSSQAAQTGSPPSTFQNMAGAPGGSIPRSESRPPKSHQPSHSRSWAETASGPSARAATSPKDYSQLTRDAALICLGFLATDNPGKEELRLAYKKAALCWHPDRQQNHGNEEVAKQKFQEISMSLELLQYGQD